MNKPCPHADKIQVLILGTLATLLVLIPQNAKVDSVMHSMFQVSLIPDKLAEYLRNDSLDNLEEHDVIYCTIFNLLEQMCKRPALRSLLTEWRYSISNSPGLGALTVGWTTNFAARIPSRYQLPRHDGSRDVSVAQCFQKLFHQSGILLRSPTVDVRLSNLCERVQEVYRLLGDITTHIGRRTSTLGVSQQWSEFHNSNALVFSDAIMDDFLPTLKTDAEYIERQLRSAKSLNSRNKRILTECASMRTGLDSGIFVIVAESRPDMMRALIIGPEDTAYAGGLFE